MKYLWLILLIAVLAWYTVVTLYVALKGVVDIKEMLAKLESRKGKS